MKKKIITILISALLPFQPLLGMEDSELRSENERQRHSRKLNDSDGKEKAKEMSDGNIKKKNHGVLFSSIEEHEDYLKKDREHESHERYRTIDNKIMQEIDSQFQKDVALRSSYNIVVDPKNKYHSESKYINVLNLSNNFISFHGVKTIFKETAMLQCLNLSGCAIDDLCCVELAKNETIQILKLSHNNISGIGVRKLAKKEGLTVLDLSYNHVDAGINRLVQIKSLTELDLSHNKILSPYARDFLIGLEHNTTLKSLKFRCPYEINQTIASLKAVTIGVLALGGLVLATGTAEATLRAMDGLWQAALAPVFTAVLAAGGLWAGCAMDSVSGHNSNAPEERATVWVGSLAEYEEYSIGELEAKHLSQNKTLLHLDLSQNHASARIKQILADTSTRIIVW